MRGLLSAILLFVTVTGVAEAHEVRPGDLELRPLEDDRYQVTPSLNEIRDTVRRQWLVDRRKTAQETFFAELRRRYVVTLDLEQYACVSTDALTLKSRPLASKAVLQRATSQRNEE